MSRRHFSIFNFTFLDWMVGFLGCVIIQLLLAQKIVEQQPCPSIKYKVLTAKIDSSQALVYSFLGADLRNRLQNEDSIVLVVTGFRDLPKDSLINGKPLANLLHRQNGNIVIPAQDKTKDSTIRTDDWYNKLNLDGEINFILKHDSADDDFRLCVEHDGKWIEYMKSADFFRKNQIIHTTDKFKDPKRIGKFYYFGEKVTQLSEVIPGVYKIYAQYRGNKKDRGKQSQKARLYFVSKQKVGSSVQLIQEIPKSVKTKTLIKTVNVLADGTLIYQ